MLRKVKFRGTIFQGEIFRGTIVQGLIFRGTIFRVVIFQGRICSGAIFLVPSPRKGIPQQGKEHASISDFIYQITYQHDH